MRDVTEQLKSAFLKGTQKYLILRFSDGTVYDGEGIDSMIDEGSMSLEQTICDESQIKFGLCNAASFSVNLFATAKRYKGFFVYPSIKSDEYSMSLGKFRVEEDKLTDDRAYRQLKCYDQMTDLLTDDVSGWYAGLTFPMTLKQFRNSLFSYFYNKYGVEQAPIKIDGVVVSDLPNDGMPVDRTISSDNAITGQMVLEKICELNGCFGVINEDGEFEYRFLMYKELIYPADDRYPANDLYPVGGAVTIGGTDNLEESAIQSSLVWEEYEYQPITKLQIHQTENDVGVVVGTDGNAYEVYDNFLVYGMGAAALQTVATNLLNVLKKTISYTPAKVAVRGRPWMQTGDLVDVVQKGWTISFPILHRTMSGITALKDEYEAKGQEYFSFNVSSTNHEVQSLLRKTLEISKSVDGLEVTATELQADMTQAQADIQVNANGISTEVSRATGAENSLSTRITQTSEAISTEVTRATGAEGNLSSRITQSAQDIELYVSNNYVPNTDYTAAQIVAKINNDGSSSVIISANKVNLSGYVTFNNLSTSGQTLINGDNIYTGTISAAQTSANSMKIYLNTGILTSGQTTETQWSTGSGSNKRDYTSISGRMTTLQNGNLLINYYDQETYIRALDGRQITTRNNSRYIDISEGYISFYGARKTSEYQSKIKPRTTISSSGETLSRDGLEIVTNKLYVNTYDGGSGDTPIYCGDVDCGNISASGHISADGYIDISGYSSGGNAIYGVDKIQTADVDGNNGHNLIVDLYGNGLNLRSVNSLQINDSDFGYDGWLTEYFGQGNGLVLKNGHGCDFRFSNGILVECSEWDW